MPVKFSTKDLIAAGLRIDPSDPARLVRAKEVTTSDPDESWDLDQLAAFASQSLSEVNRLQSQAEGLRKRSAVHLYRAGRALSLARTQLKDAGKWCAWQDQHHLPRTSVFEAIQLFERATSEDQLDGLEISKAKTVLGITKPRKQRLNSQNGERLEFAVFEPQHRQSKVESPAEQPPPKEDLSSLLMVLVKIANRLQLSLDEAKQTDWTKISKDDVRRTLTDIIQATVELQRIVG